MGNEARKIFNELLVSGRRYMQQQGRVNKKEVGIFIYCGYGINGRE